MTSKVKQVIAELEADGWFLDRWGKGDHRIYKHPIKPGIVPVAGKLSANIPIGTLKKIYRLAGLSK
jgi:predicted RNA binding protein YcfA (HicA-like mRNA interferase family)